MVPISYFHCLFSFLCPSTRFSIQRLYITGRSRLYLSFRPSCVQRRQSENSGTIKQGSQLGIDRERPRAHSLSENCYRDSLQASIYLHVSGAPEVGRLHLDRSLQYVGGNFSKCYCVAIQCLELERDPVVYFRVKEMLWLISCGKVQWVISKMRKNLVMNESIYTLTSINDLRHTFS